MGWVTEGLEFQSRYGQEFSLLRIVQTGSGAHPASYPMCTGGSFPGVKQQEHEADHSSQTSAEVKKTWIYLSLAIHLHGIMFNWLSKGTTLCIFYENALTFTTGRLFSASVAPMVANRSATNYFLILPDLRTCN
jgi:hypothetical protein